MRLVDRTGPGAIGLNYMWLPCWIGMNEALVKEIDQAIAPGLLGKEITDETLNEAQVKVLSFLAERFPQLPGLFDYLDGLKFVTNNG